MVMKMISNLLLFWKQSVIYFIFVLGFDLLPGPSICWASIRSWCTWLVGNKRYLLWPKGLTEPFIVSSVESHASNFEDEDEDVTAERVRVLSGAAKDSIIYLQNLRKVSARFFNSMITLIK